MSAAEVLAREFERHRPRLRALAFRMLGSAASAEDAVQEAWLRASRAETEAVANLEAWLSTVVGRICLDVLRARKARREEALDGAGPSTAVSASANPEEEALLTASVGAALLVVMERLSPEERVAFVLHDVCAVPFEEIAALLHRTPAAARQLASRGRRSVQPPEPRADTAQQWAAAQAFLAAVRNRDLAALLAVLAPDVVRRADAAVTGGAPAEVQGAATVARNAMAFAAWADRTGPAWVDRAPGLVVAGANGRLTRAIRFTVADGRITAVEIIGEPRVSRLAVAVGAWRRRVATRRSGGHATRHGPASTMDL